MLPDGTRKPLHATPTDPSTAEELVVHTTVFEIVIGRTRLRVDRDRLTGEQTYFINDEPCDVNAYLTVTQAHLDFGQPRVNRGST
jgi:hypothetical protein